MKSDSRKADASDSGRADAKRDASKSSWRKTSMRAPVLRGRVARRILVGLRVDPTVAKRLLPGGLEPRLVQGYAIAGVAFTRLEGLRTRLLPIPFGTSSDSVEHRIAVEPNHSFYVLRRDANSAADAFVTHAVVAAERGRSRFDIDEDDGLIAARAQSFDGRMAIRVEADEIEAWPAESVFSSLLAAVRWFGDDVPTAWRSRLGATKEAIRGGDPRERRPRSSLRWIAQPLGVRRFESTYLADPVVFPDGSVEVDHALCLRDVEEVWHSAPDLHGGRLRV